MTNNYAYKMYILKQ